MNAKAYAKKQYPIHKTFQKIAEKAFEAGAENRMEPRIVQELNELREYKKENEKVWNDPEMLANLIAGM